MMVFDLPVRFFLYLNLANFFQFRVFSDFFFAEGQIGLSLNIKCSSLHIVSRSKVSFPDEVNSIEVRKL